MTEGELTLCNVLGQPAPLGLETHALMADCVLLTTLLRAVEEVKSTVVVSR